jgi:serine/threonine protein phosphatase 1
MADLDLERSPWHMATIVVGDIHGNAAALSDLLGKIAHVLTSADTVVFLGDYIDRGSDTKNCVDQILHFRGTGPAVVIALSGNHQDWLLRTYRDWRVPREAGRRDRHRPSSD